jgi:hypothetical protein
LCTVRVCSVARRHVLCLGRILPSAA